MGGAWPRPHAHDTGEGSISSYRENRSDLIWEIGSGYFGGRNETVRSRPAGLPHAVSPRVKMIGVTPEIAAARDVPLGACHTDRCPSGVSTQSPWRQRALVADDKASRVAQLNRNTMAALAELVGAGGVSHPRELRPMHILKRISPSEVQSFAEVYQFLAPGELLAGALLCPGRWRTPAISHRFRWCNRPGHSGRTGPRDVSYGCHGPALW
jgi:hypothetical protein